MHHLLLAIGHYALFFHNVFIYVLAAIIGSALTLVDYRQTRYISNHPLSYYEKINPVLKGHPTISAVEVWFGIAITVLTFGWTLFWNILPALGFVESIVLIAMEIRMVTNNDRIGIPFW